MENGERLVVVFGSTRNFASIEMIKQISTDTIKRREEENNN